MRQATRKRNGRLPNWSPPPKALLVQNSLPTCGMLACVADRARDLDRLNRRGACLSCLESDLRELASFFCEPANSLISCKSLPSAVRLEGKWLPMKFKQNPKLARQLRPFGKIVTRGRHDNARIHPFVGGILRVGEQRLRDRFAGSGVGPADFVGPALVELERRQLVHRVEARIYLPIYIRSGLHRYARAEGGTPIWLPSVRLEELGGNIWQVVRPTWKNGKVVWP